MFTLYSAEWCAYCQKAKQLLKETDYSFEVKDVDHEPENKATIKALGLRTIPQIWHDDRHIGGYDDLVEYLNGTS